MSNPFQRKSLVLISFILISFNVFSQGIDHWETVVYDTSQWNYLVPNSSVDPTWAQLNFDDSSWATAMGGFGYGDGDDSTSAVGSSVFVRHVFAISNLTDIDSLLLHVDYDDGYVAYLNGVEIARRNLGTVGVPVDYNQYTPVEHEAVLYAGGTPEGVDVPASQLIAGANILAIQVHNRNAGSSDLSCRPFLMIGTSSPAIVYGPNPTWFAPPVIFSSLLPIVVLNTNGQTIPDDPRIVIEMGIIDNGVGDANFLTDPFNDYNGLINIERRGSSSQSFPKKQYALETQDSLDNSLDVSLLGMPIENDWILHAPYSDKSLMRNYLTYNWWRDMGWYTTRTKYCEVILNGDYQGVYILMEQIKWDNDRVDIEKMDGDDNQGDSLTGGYILKVDKTTGSGQFDWTSHVDTFQGQPKVTRFQYDYPNRDTITQEQEDYIQQFVYDWEQSLIDSTFMEPDSGYRKYVDANSFIDFFLIQEITKNVDGYRLSTYLNKQRDSRGGKLQAGPAWDFNITLGNANYCEGGEAGNYALDFPCNQEVIPFWWHRMNQDSVYWNQVQCRYLELRSDLWSWPTINAQIDSNVAYLGQASTRNFERWDILNSYVWPNNWIGGTYDNEIDSLKLWIQQRLSWLDQNIGSPSGLCESASRNDITISEINYHSADTFDTHDWFELQNLTSDTLDISFWTLYDDNEFNTYTFPMGIYILPDSFLVVTKDELDFESFQPDITNRVGSFGWGIGNSGDHITLRDFNNNYVLEVEFDDEAPWPTEPDGNSHTLEKWDWATDLNDPASWHAGCPGGSPGRAFTYCVYASVDEAEASSFALYPNPATGHVWVDSQQPSLLSIYNVSGQKVGEQTLQVGKSKIDVSFLNSGLYLFEIITQSNNRFTKRLIVSPS
ncbi:CotH kinase family protein [Flavobacteriales bacterium]|nr:CotH kinase family protein [Flavobacteriales bacterium]